MNTKLERYFSGLLFATSLFLIYVAWGYVAPIAYDPLGPRPYPMLVFSLMALCTLFLLIRPKPELINLNYTPTIIKNLLICLIVILAYALLFNVLGFPIATAFMSAIIGRLFGGKTGHCIITGIIMGIVLYFLFDRALDVSLPLGFWIG